MKIAAYPSLRPDSADYENPDSYTVHLQQNRGKSGSHALPE